MARKNVMLQDSSLDTLDPQTVISQVKDANGDTVLSANPTTKKVSGVNSYKIDADALISYPTLSDFPASGEDGKIYLAQDTNYMYRWSTSSYVQIGGGQAPVTSVNSKTGAVVLEISDIINAQHELSSDLVDDTNHTNKFVTAAEKSQITTNQQAIAGILDGTSIDSFADVETALSGKEDSSNKVTSIGAASTDAQYPSAKAVYDAIDALPEPMVFQGSVGVNGTVEWANFPAAAASNVGYTYKVITAHDVVPICKVGDTLISNGSEWVVIPSGDEENSGVKYIKEFSTNWSSKTWTGLTNFNGVDIWSDGDNIYYSNGNLTQYILDKSTDQWSTKAWSGLSNIVGRYIWTDGNNIYYSKASGQWVLNKSTSTWVAKSWNGLSSFDGTDVWTDGADIYYSTTNGSEQYVLNRTTSTWHMKTWNKTIMGGTFIWTDGSNTYYSGGTSNSQYILNRSTGDWDNKIWNGFATPNGGVIWTDGENIYHSYASNQYVLDKATSTWISVTWTGGVSTISGSNVWTDGTNIFFSQETTHYSLDYIEDTTEYVAKIAVTGSYNDLKDIPILSYNDLKDQPSFKTIYGNSILGSGNISDTGLTVLGGALSGKVITKTWSGVTSLSGVYIWTDGDNTYYSSGTTQYVLNKSTGNWETKTWSGLTEFFGNYIWTDGINIYFSHSGSNKVLNKATSTWEDKTWTGLTSFEGASVWTDGDNVYYSTKSSGNYVLNKETSTWSSKTWTGLTSFDGIRIWTDGDNIYCSNVSSSYGTTGNYVLDKSTSTWSSKTWSGYTSFNGQFVWTDGINIYLSSAANQYVLNKATSTWVAKSWDGLSSFNGTNVWTDGTNYYYSSSADQYVFATQAVEQVAKVAVTGDYEDLSNKPTDVTEAEIAEANAAAEAEVFPIVSVSGDNITFTNDCITTSGDDITINAYSTFGTTNGIYL